MKVIMTVLVGVILLGACESKVKQQDTLQKAMDDLRDSMSLVINQKEAQMNDMMATFNEIQEGFQEINEAEGRLNLDKDNPERMSAEDIKENLDFIHRTMQLNKERIAKLEGQLKTNAANAAKLRQTIESLNQQMEQKEQQLVRLEQELKAKDVKIEEQGKQIETLNTDVKNLKEEKEQKEQEVAQQDKELNTAWYVFGTKRELKNQNILVDGEVMKSNSANRNYFTKIDIRDPKDQTIHLYSKRAELLTSHPAGSYNLVRNEKKEYSLQITDPQKFWSVSKYLVILVK